MLQDAEQTEAGTRGIAIDEHFQSVSDKPIARRLWLLSLPFILGRHPFIQGLTSCHEIGEAVGETLASAVAAPSAGHQDEVRSA